MSPRAWGSGSSTGSMSTSPAVRDRQPLRRRSATAGSISACRRHRLRSVPRIKGLPIVSLACAAYDATMGVCVLNDGPIKTPKDLEGHSVASVLLSADYPFFAPFAAKTGIDTAKITRVQVDNKVRNRLLPDGKVDAITGFASSVMPVYAATGV